MERNDAAKEGGEGKKEKLEYCPVCGSRLVHMEGCIECPKCGWSACEL